MTTTSIFKSVLCMVTTMMTMHMFAQEEPCSQENVRGESIFSYTQGMSNNLSQKSANDLIVPQGKNFILNSITANLILRNSDYQVTGAIIKIYDDVDGLPGTLIHEQSDIAILSHVSNGSTVSQNMPIYTVSYDINPILLEGNPDEEVRYWVQTEYVNNATSTTNAGFVHTETTLLDDGVGHPMARFTNSSGAWAYVATVPANLQVDAVISFFGDCENIPIVLPYECTITCSDNILEYVPNGSPTLIVNYEVSFSCEPEGEGVELVLANGLVSGSEFPVGTTNVTYNLIYEEVIIDTCSFEIVIEEMEEMDCKLTCPENIHLSIPLEQENAVVDYEIVYRCGADAVNPSLVLIEGFESGSTFPIGTTIVTHHLIHEGGLIDICTFEVTIDNDLSVDNPASNIFSVYPNPFTDILNIYNQLEIEEINIYDLAGRRIYTQGKSNMETQLDLSFLLDGVYILDIRTENENQIFRIAKK